MAEPLIFAGGGLAGCLVALALAERRPEVDLLLVEASDRLGGNHVWSFFDSDVAPAHRWLVEPLIAARWDDYEVRFPAHSRRIAQGYRSIVSERLDAVVRDRLGPGRLRLGKVIAAVETGAVVLEGGERIAGTVIDARGAGDLSALSLGWQKFVGRIYETERPHGVARPVIMDATVDQTDGYRFVYLLPFSATRLMVEDTYYADGAELDVAGVGARVEAYRTAIGLQDARIEREETGVLPVTMGGDLEAYLVAGGPAAKIGVRGGFFHPTTGYSLPDAVRLAARLAEQRDLSLSAVSGFIGAEAQRLWRERRFYRMINKMLFKAARPHERYKVLERFYRLSPALIGRFYAGQTTTADKARILLGKPPVPIGAAVKALAS